MKLLKPLLYSALIGLAIPAMVSCDGSPVDQTDGTLSFDLQRFDVAAITASPASTAEMPQVLKEGDVITLTPIAVSRADEEIISLPYETTMIGTNTRQIELLRRPSGFSPPLPSRIANWARTNGNVNSATLSTSVSFDENKLTSLITSVLADTSPALGSDSLREALRIIGDPNDITDEEVERIEDGFKALGIETFYNQVNVPTGLLATISREITFTATSTNADTVGSLTISGTYLINETHRNMKLEFNTVNGGLVDEFYEPTFTGSTFSLPAETGVFTITLNGISAS